MKHIKLPSSFSFKSHDLFTPDAVLSFFDWTVREEEVLLDFSTCQSANYQALALISLYVWHLKLQDCQIHFDLNSTDGSSLMWKRMGASGWSYVLFNNSQNFRSNQFKPLLAIRNQNDFSKAISKAEEFTKGFNVEYEKTLRYVISELLYNTMEHGKCYRRGRTKDLQIPSIIQFTWYQTRNEISFIIADLGIGIKKHLEQTYPTFLDDSQAIIYSLKPQVSGTFGQRDPYVNKNNAGVGLYISSNIIRRLNADMHLISGNGLVHVSPRDVTSKTISAFWPGTIVLVTMRIEDQSSLNLHQMMNEFRQAASKELEKGETKDSENTFRLIVFNFFGRMAENKIEAISFRDKYLIPAVDSGKSIVIDFQEVVSSPHSFLSALLATPIKKLGMGAYKKIKLLNTVSEIRETIDFILDENTEPENPT